MRLAQTSQHSMAAHTAWPLLLIAVLTPDWMTTIHGRGFHELVLVALAVFLALAGVFAVNRVSRTLRDGVRALDNDTQQRLLEADMLCTFIQKTTQLDPHTKPGQSLAGLAHSIFRLESAAIFDADLREMSCAGTMFDNVEEVMQNIYVFETDGSDPERGLIRRALRMGKLPIGAMLLRGETSARTADAIASVLAITFDRYHALANESRTESARQTEQLRTTVLDSLAHAYKTPLTAIEAASSGLVAMGGLTTAQAVLVALIEEQADQLSHLTNSLLMTARLDASHLVPQLMTVSITPLIEDVVASLRQELSNHSVEVAIPCEELSLCCDRGLLVALLTQYLDNASKYADAGTTITMQAVEDGGAVVFSVRSFGPVVSEVDYERVFDRYYRCSPADNNAPGTGIGLSVAKRAAQTHGGDVWVTSDASRGTIFYASLPIAREGRAIQ
ncbi:MAG: ATP-binding protein [Acidobacteriota bacterium]|nr:ATP-binding protein [Acidobacteriota bacterium]